MVRIIIQWQKPFLLHWYWWWVTSKPILIFVNRNGPYTNLQSQANSFATIWMRRKVTTKRHILTKNRKKQLIWRLIFRSRRVLTLPWTARSSKTPQQIEAVYTKSAWTKRFSFEASNPLPSDSIYTSCNLFKCCRE